MTTDLTYDELVLAHLLPFSGVAHAGCPPGERILGLSMLARLVEHFAARPQTQERLTRQVADCLVGREVARRVLRPGWSAYLTRS